MTAYRRLSPVLITVAALVIGGVLFAVTPDDHGQSYAQTALMRVAGTDHDCTLAFFPSRQDATAYYDFKGYGKGNDPENLNPNNDAWACGNLPDDQNYVNRYLGDQRDPTTAPTTARSTPVTHIHTKFDVPK